jgi:hypothetical protein
MFLMVVISDSDNEVNFGDFHKNYLPYFPAYKTHFSPRKMLPKFDLRLMRQG